jgi:hypothetical protein
VQQEQDHDRSEQQLALLEGQESSHRRASFAVSGFRESLRSGDSPRWLLSGVFSCGHAYSCHCEPCRGEAISS